MTPPTKINYEAKDIFEHTVHPLYIESIIYVGLDKALTHLEKYYEKKIKDLK